MQGRSTFEITLGTTILFLFLSIVAFILNMLFYNFIVNRNDTFHGLLMVLCATLQAGLIMGFFVSRLKQKYRRQNAFQQVKALNFFMIVLALIVFGIDSLILSRGKNIFKRQVSDAEFLESNFNKIIKEVPQLDSSRLREVIARMKDSIYGAWNWVSDYEHSVQFRYPRHTLIKDSTFQVINSKKYRIVQNKVITDNTDDPNKGYSVSIINYDWKKNGETEDELFELQKNYLIHAMEATLLQEIEVKNGNHTGRQFYLDMPALRLKAFTQVFPVNSKVYILTVVTDYEHLFNNNISKFLKGVEFIEDPL